MLWGRGVVSKYSCLGHASVQASTSIYSMRSAPPQRMYLQILIFYTRVKREVGVPFCGFLDSLTEVLKNKLAKKLEDHLIRERKTRGKASCQSPWLLGEGLERRKS